MTFYLKDLTFKKKMLKKPFQIFIYFERNFNIEKYLQTWGVFLDLLAWFTADCSESLRTLRSEISLSYAAYSQLSSFWSCCTRTMSFLPVSNNLSLSPLVYLAAFEAWLLSRVLFSAICMGSITSLSFFCRFWILSPSSFNTREAGDILPPCWGRGWLIVTCWNKES